MSECASRKAATPRRRWGFLGRLFRDRRGNTLVIVGAAMIPLAAMIGSGVDMSRAYMAKTRLQSACDAAALAGRRVMQNDTLGTNVEPEARRFFHFNFPKTTVNGVTRGPYQTEEIINPTVTRPAQGTVRVSATTRIPTTVMRMFGFTTLPLSVTCDAALHFVNTDVMLVLDTTGSMYCLPSELGTCGRTVEVPGSRIVALRAAVMALYDELEPTQIQLQANNLRLRYGIVPYSSSVNVGRLITAMDALPANQPRNSMRDLSPYQSREVLYNTPQFNDTAITTTQAGLLVNPGVQRFQTGTSPVVSRLISNTNCANFGNNIGFTQSGTSPTGGTFTATAINNDNDIYDPDGAAPPQAGVPAAGVNFIRYQFSRNTAAWTTGTANRVCDRNVTITRRLHTGRFTVSSPVQWRYIQSDFDTSQLRGGTTTLASNTAGSVATSDWYNERELATLATGVGLTTVTWNGCIEERDTTPTIVLSPDVDDLAVPAAAFDLNINLIPTGETERWRPHWPQILWRRNVNQASTTTPGDVEYMGDNTDDSVACPAEARRMQAWTEANLQSYVNSLVPRGYTYHDIGMIWGARMLSNASIFAADNPDTFNGMPVTRHIIFMTDGELMPQCTAYSSWGLERNDKRVTVNASCSNADMYDRHMQRFQMACNAARGRGFSVWVIAFGVDLTDEMRSCASNPSQASAATNSPELLARFRQIGSNIGALRLTQ
jgi:Flp pilus assembly protein TadG